MASINYTVVIKHLGRYYIQKESKNSSQFEFPTYKLNSKNTYTSKDFNSSNTELKKVIAAEITRITPFGNNRWTGKDAYKAVSLQRIKVKDPQNTKRQIKLVIFTSNTLNNNKKNEFIQYVSEYKKSCNTVTEKILEKLKWQNNWSVYLFYVFCF